MKRATWISQAQESSVWKYWLVYCIRVSRYICDTRILVWKSSDSRRIHKPTRIKLSANCKNQEQEWHTIHVHKLDTRLIIRKQNNTWKTVATARQRDENLLILIAIQSHSCAQHLAGISLLTPPESIRRKHQSAVVKPTITRWCNKFVWQFWVQLYRLTILGAITSSNYSRVR